MEIFKKTAPNSKEIEFKDLKVCLDRFALAYFQENEQFDTDDKKREAFYELIGSHDPYKFRNKFQGVRVAFNSHEKEDFRVQKENGRYMFKLKPTGGKTVEEIKEDIKRRNEQRNREKLEKAQEKLKEQNFKKMVLERQKAKNQGRKRIISGEFFFDFFCRKFILWNTKDREDALARGKEQSHLGKVGELDLCGLARD